MLDKYLHLLNMQSSVDKDVIIIIIIIIMIAKHQYKRNPKEEKCFLPYIKQKSKRNDGQEENVQITRDSCHEENNCSNHC